MRAHFLLPIALATGCDFYFEENLGGAPLPEPAFSEAFGALRWAITIGGVDDDGLARVAVNPQGDVIVAGGVQGEVELDGVTFDTGEDGSCFLARLDGVDGSYRWGFPLTGLCNVRDLDLDAEGNLIVSGRYDGTVDFGGDSLSAVTADMFVASYTPDGTLRWVRGLGPVSNATAESVAIADNGDVFVAGSYNGTSDLGGEWNPAENESEAFVVAYDSEGTYLWGHAFIADGWQRATSISIGDGDLIVSGTLSHDVSVGGDVLVSNAWVRAWLARYTTDGGHVWSHTFGPEGAYASSNPMSVVRGDGTILVVSDESESNTFPDGTVLRAFDLAGAEQWITSSFADGMVHALAVAPSGAVLLGGFAGNLEPAPFGSSMLENGMLLAAHDPSGIPIEGRTYEGTSTSQDIVTGVAASPLGATAIGGWFERSIDIGAIELDSAGGMEIIIAVFNAPGD
jgi:hypothetical protein